MVSYHFSTWRVRSAGVRLLRGGWRTYCACLLRIETIGEGFAAHDGGDVMDEGLGVFGIG